ncbi:hypothetical protein BC938DRAFT_476216 [Jimgerdemannia flammicorona]|uniref:Uncharacterized protein n=1 Tax=Jimgerdemannia flammicorona TaxID=994334 RepID=A0A433QQS4_9FUNG|nr:hypothetical protein BC938DRAFT_476216 [Jimgerdemannia flammicorona]
MSAEAHKAAGNKLFSQQLYEDAVKEYSTAIVQYSDSLALGWLSGGRLLACSLTRTPRWTSESVIS